MVGIGNRELSGALLLIALLAFAGIAVQGASAGKSVRDTARQKAIREGERRAKKPVVLTRLRRDGSGKFSAKATWTRRSRSGPQRCALGIEVARARTGLRARSDRRIQCRGISRDKYNAIEFQIGPGPKYCPGNAGETWNAKPAVLGKTLEKATAIATRHECEVRVVRRDGVGFLITADLRFTRLNFAVKGPDQRVIRIVGVF